MNKKGIAFGGNMIVDVLYLIVWHPNPGELTTITEGIARSTGGALCNVIVDLAKRDPALPLTSLGRMDTADKVANLARERNYELVVAGVQKTVYNDLGDEAVTFIDQTPG